MMMKLSKSNPLPISISKPPLRLKIKLSKPPPPQPLTVAGGAFAASPYDFLLRWSTTAKRGRKALKTKPQQQNLSDHLITSEGEESGCTSVNQPRQCSAAAADSNDWGSFLSLGGGLTLLSGVASTLGYY